MSTLTDEQIRSIIRWNYKGIQTGTMARIIFGICCIVRDRIQGWAESEELAKLRDELMVARQCQESLLIALAEERDTDWRERYLRLHKIHVEDVRRRKEVRRFRLTNFSIAELGAELQRRTTKGADA